MTAAMLAFLGMEGGGKNELLRWYLTITSVESRRGWCGKCQTHYRRSIYLGSPKSILVVIINHKI
jgi:hypothetical protein